MIFDCAIVGSGPAGITASIQVARAGYAVVLFEKKKGGGLLRNAYRIENYLGFPGISGYALISLFKSHLKKFKITFIKKEVTKITKKRFFQIETNDGKFMAQSVILATGTVPNRAGLPGEQKLAGKKVFYEIADLPAIKKKKIAIIGGGDVGVDYALNIQQQHGHPFIIAKHKIRCIQSLKEKAEKKRIPYFENITLQGLTWKNHNIEIVCAKNTFHADFALIAVGRHYPLPPIKVKTKGLFLAWNPHNKNHRQVHISTGYGMEAALNSIKYLEKK